MMLYEDALRVFDYENIDKHIGVNTREYVLDPIRGPEFAAILFSLLTKQWNDRSIPIDDDGVFTGFAGTRFMEIQRFFYRWQRDLVDGWYHIKIVPEGDILTDLSFDKDVTVEIHIGSVCLYSGSSRTLQLPNGGLPFVAAPFSSLVVRICPNETGTALPRMTTKLMLIDDPWIRHAMAALTRTYKLNTRYGLLCIEKRHRNHGEFRVFNVWVEDWRDAAKRKREELNIYERELMAAAWHPRRVARWLLCNEKDECYTS